MTPEFANAWFNGSMVLCIIIMGGGLIHCILKEKRHNASLKRKTNNLTPIETIDIPKNFNGLLKLIDLDKQKTIIYKFNKSQLLNIEITDIEETDGQEKRI